MREGPVATQVALAPGSGGPPTASGETHAGGIGKIIGWIASVGVPIAVWFAPLPLAGCPLTERRCSQAFCRATPESNGDSCVPHGFGIETA